MVEAIIDRIATSDIGQRYKLKSRTAIANRLKALGIKEERDRRKSYVPVEALEKLDSLDRCLKQPGATLEECAKKVNENTILSLHSPLPDPHSPFIRSGCGDESPHLSFVQLVREIASALRPTTDPLAPLVSLSTAASHGWLLTSSQVKALVGVSPRGTTFTRGSFAFVRSGKIGRESGWRVEKFIGSSNQDKEFDALAIPSGE